MPRRSRNDPISDYLKRYKFVETTVNNLLTLYRKVLCTHTSLKALALKTMVNTQIERITSIMNELPDLEFKRKVTFYGDTSRVTMERDIRENHQRLVQQMSRIVKFVQQLHPHLDLWYNQEGQPSSDREIWLAFDTSCSKIPENFPKATTELSNLLTQLQDLDSVI